MSAKLIKGQRFLRLCLRRGERFVGDFICWDQASLDEAKSAKIHGAAKPSAKAWDTVTVMGETFGQPEYGWTGYGGKLTRDEVLGPRGFATIVSRCQLRLCAKHRNLACCPICEPHSS